MKDERFWLWLSLLVICIVLAMTMVRISRLENTLYGDKFLVLPMPAKK